MICFQTFATSANSLPNGEVTEARLQLVVDQDRIDGSLKQLEGSAKETFGKVTGDSKTEAKGAREKAVGKVQNSIGGAKDSVRETIGK